MGVVGGMVLGQLFLFALTPAITRIYDPALFGIFSVYLAVTAFDVGVCFGYEKAIPLPENNSEGLALLILSVASAFLVSLCVFILVRILDSQTEILSILGNVRSLAYFVPFSIFAVGLFQSLVGWTMRRLDFRSLSLARFSLYATTGVSQLVIGLLVDKSYGLVLGHLLGFACASLVMIVKLRAHKPGFGDVSLNSVRIIGVRYNRFMIFGAPAAVLNSFALQLPTLGIAMLHGAQVAGWYGLAMRIFGIPLSLVGQALGQTLRAKLSESVRISDRTAGILPLLKSAMGLQIIVIIPLIIVASIGPRFFAFVFGSDWETSGLYVQLLLPLILGALVVAPLHSVFDVLERPEMHMYRESFRALLLLIVFAFAHFYEFAPSETVFSVSIAGLAVYLVSGLMILRLVCK